MTEDEVPPHDTDTERAALCACMEDARAFEVARQMLTVDDFYSKFHASVYCLMVRTGNSDPILLRCGCTASERELLGDLMCAQSSPASIESYCERLRSMTAARIARRQAQDLGLASGSESPDSLSARLHAAADEVAAKSPHITDDPVGELYAEFDAAVSGKRFSAPMPWEMLGRDTRALLPGTVTILCGSPGATKSLALGQLLRHLLSVQIASCGLMLEDGASYHLRRMAAQITGISDLTDDAWCRANPERVERVKAELGHTLQTLRRSIEAPSVQNKCTPDELVAWVRSKARTHRVLAIDPITMMVRGSKSWEGDERFLFGAKRVIEEHGVSLVLVTHPRKMPTGANAAQMSMDDLAGGSAYSRFSQTILFLRAHDVKKNPVERANGTLDEEYNRTMTVFKARNGRGVEGNLYAFRFEASNLTLVELGRIRSDR